MCSEQFLEVTYFNVETEKCKNTFKSLLFRKSQTSCPCYSGQTRIISLMSRPFSSHGIYGEQVRVSVFYQATRGALFALTLWHKILNDVNAGRASVHVTNAVAASLETQSSIHPPLRLSYTRPHNNRHLHFHACNSIGCRA